MIKLLFLDRHFYWQYVYFIELFFNYVLFDRICTVDARAACGRHSRAERLAEASASLGVLAEITGLRHAWACVVSLSLAHNLLPVVWLSRFFPLMSFMRRHGNLLSVCNPKVLRWSVGNLC